MAKFLAKTTQVHEGKSLIVTGPKGLEIALIKLDGKIYAIENVCPHMQGPVGEGEIEGCIITCPWHGWQFNIKTGQCQNEPGEDVKKIPIKIEGEDIYLDTDLSSCS